mmetsp:Transcript_45423/g.98774  ORF Transcript_45423/g.98774 Transcript_45423/m.98774 type:complete len:231 (+) Transcript_45423:93-785(+)
MTFCILPTFCDLEAALTFRNVEVLVDFFTRDASPASSCCSSATSMPSSASTTLRSASMSLSSLVPSDSSTFCVSLTFCALEAAWWTFRAVEVLVAFFTSDTFAASSSCSSGPSLSSLSSSSCMPGASWTFCVSLTFCASGSSLISFTLEAVWTFCVVEVSVAVFTSDTFTASSSCSSGTLMSSMSSSSCVPGASLTFCIFPAFRALRAWRIFRTAEAAFRAREVLVDFFT